MNQRPDVSPWLVLLGAGLGTARLIDAAKPFVSLDRTLKLILSAAVSMLLSTGLLKGQRWQTLVAAAGAAWGVSQLAHGTTSYLQSGKDEARGLLWDRSNRQNHLTTPRRANQAVATSG